MARAISEFISGNGNRDLSVSDRFCSAAGDEGSIPGSTVPCGSGEPGELYLFPYMQACICGFRRKINIFHMLVFILLVLAGSAAFAALDMPSRLIFSGQWDVLDYPGIMLFAVRRQPGQSSSEEDAPNCSGRLPLNSPVPSSPWRISCVGQRNHFFDGNPLVVYFPFAINYAETDGKIGQDQITFELIILRQGQSYFLKKCSRMRSEGLSLSGKFPLLESIFLSTESRDDMK